MSDATASYVHEYTTFASGDQLLAETGPWLRDAIDRGDAVALACSDDHNRAILEALDSHEGVVVLPRSEIYRKPVEAIDYYRDMMRDHVPEGTARVRLLGEVDFGAEPRGWAEWGRYEALCNYALAPYALWTVCAYDERTLPTPVLGTAPLTHPYRRHHGEQVVNPAFADPASLLLAHELATDPVAPAADPPAATYTGIFDFPRMHDGLREVLADQGLTGDKVDDVLIAVHEVTSNALRHGVPPVTVRAWVTPRHVECTVTDHGAGFEDILAGYVRDEAEDAALPDEGLGLWIARRLCDELAAVRSGQGFTVRLMFRR